MTTADAATIAAIREKTAAQLRTTADALALIQSPLGRPSQDPAISQLLADRSAQLFQAVQGKILTTAEAADALNISRQRAYVLLNEHQETLQKAFHARMQPEAIAAARTQILQDLTEQTTAARLAANPAHTQLPAADV